MQGQSQIFQPSSKMPCARRWDVESVKKGLLLPSCGKFSRSSLQEASARFLSAVLR